MLSYHLIMTLLIPNGLCIDFKVVYKQMNLDRHIFMLPYKIRSEVRKSDKIKLFLSCDLAKMKNI